MNIVIELMFTLENVHFESAMFMKCKLCKTRYVCNDEYIVYRFYIEKSSDC